MSQCPICKKTKQFGVGIEKKIDIRKYKKIPLRDSQLNTGNNSLKCIVLINFLVYNKPSHPKTRETTARITRIIMTHFSRLKDILIMPRMTEKPNSKATISIIIPIIIKMLIPI